MRKYALVVSLALLFAAFMWSCQQQDPAPLSPEGSISLGKGKPGPKPEPAKYRVEFKVAPAAPAMEEDFIIVASLDEAVANEQESVLKSESHGPKEMSVFDDISSFSSFIDACVKEFGIPGPDDSFGGSFGGNLSVRQESCTECGTEFFTGYFSGHDSHGYHLVLTFYGIIDEGDDFPPVGSNTTTIRSNVSDHPNPKAPTGSHKNRVSIRFQSGKGKDKVVCHGGVDNRPWRIVITRT